MYPGNFQTKKFPRAARKTPFVAWVLTSDRKTNEQNRRCLLEGSVVGKIGLRSECHESGFNRTFDPLGVRLDPDVADDAFFVSEDNGGDFDDIKEAKSRVLRSVGDAPGEAFFFEEIADHFLQRVRGCASDSDEINVSFACVPVFSDNRDHLATVRTSHRPESQQQRLAFVVLHGRSGFTLLVVESDVGDFFTDQLVCIFELGGSAHCGNFFARSELLESLHKGVVGSDRFGQVSDVPHDDTTVFIDESVTRESKPRFEVRCELVTIHDCGDGQFEFADAFGRGFDVCSRGSFDSGQKVDFAFVCGQRRELLKDLQLSLRL